MSARSLVALLAALMLTACGAGSRPGPATVPTPGETISFAIGPCFGFCPVYAVSVAPDGGVRFEGQRHTAVLGERTRRVGVPDYLKIARDLAPFHPAAGTDAIVECTVAVSDTSPYKITWTDAAGHKTTATLQSGCPDGPGQALVQLLRNLPGRLGIAGWAKQTARLGASRG